MLETNAHDGAHFFRSARPSDAPGIYAREPLADACEQECAALDKSTSVVALIPRLGPAAREKCPVEGHRIAANGCS